MYEFWYDYAKQKYGEKAKLCCMDTNSLIVYIKIEDIYVHISKDVETRFDPSSYELDRLLPKEVLIMWENNDRFCCINTKKI